MANRELTNSVYRSPLKNHDTTGAAPTSRHMHGDAADLKNVSKMMPEWQAMCDAASAAQADFLEPTSGPCKLLCAHADWRFHGADVFAK